MLQKDNKNIDKTIDKENEISGNLLKRKADRNYGIDLLRIISMIMVVGLHVLNNGGLLAGALTQSSAFYPLAALEIIFFCAVNCYALISGFVGVNVKFKISRIIVLWAQVVFISVVLSAIFAIVKPNVYGYKDIIKAFFPFTLNAYWYFSAYIGLFIFMPLLNYVLNGANQNILKWTLTVAVIVITIFSLINGNVFQLDFGYSALWLIVLYLVGGYFRKYSPLKNVKGRTLFFVVAVLVAITFSVKVLFRELEISLLGFHADSLITYISPTIFLYSVFLLELFSRIKMSKNSSIIKFFAPLTFGVYIIHTQACFNAEVMASIYKLIGGLNPILLFLSAIGLTIGIYIACSIIDYLRSLLFNGINITKMLSNLENKIKNKFGENENV